jgi:hypothetical protein
VYCGPNAEKEFTTILQVNLVVPGRHENGGFIQNAIFFETSRSSRCSAN